MFCNVCGNSIDTSTQFCPKCGTPLASAGPQPQQPGGQMLPSIAYVTPQGVKAKTGEWIGQGWELVKSDIMTFAIMALLLGIIASCVPLILHGPLMAGFHYAFMNKILSGRTEIGDLFKGFNMFVPNMVAGILIGLFVGIGSIFCIIPGIMLAAAYSFTYLLIIDKKMDFWPAMQASMDIVKQDWVGFIIFLLVAGLINVLGFFACLVGMFVTMPIMYGAITVAYKEIVGFDRLPQI